MGALSAANIALKTREGSGRVVRSVKSSTAAYGGGFVMRNTDGDVLPLSTSPAVFDGILGESKAAATTDRKIDVSRRGAFLATISGVTKADIGKPVYCSTDNPADVTLSWTPTATLIGWVVDLSYAPVTGSQVTSQCWVEYDADMVALVTTNPTLYSDSESLLSGGTVQGTRAQSATQNYPLGMKRTYKDGRAFRYVKARTALHSEFGACYNAKTIACAVAPTQATGAGAAGDYKVTITVANSDGLAGDGVVAADELVGGYVVIGNGTSQHPQNRRITANTVAASNKSTLTLDEPLDTVVTVNTTNIETLMNPWILSDGNVTSSGYVTFRGMPARELTLNDYGFIQTQGPCWITSDSHTCDSSGDRQIYFATNGSVVSGNDVTGDVNVQQLAGHAIDASSSGASNAPFVNLTMEAA